VLPVVTVAAREGSGLNGTGRKFGGTVTVAEK
jgi:hypothetical protein